MATDWDSCLKVPTSIITCQVGSRVPTRCILTTETLTTTTAQVFIPAKALLMDLRFTGMELLLDVVIILKQKKFFFTQEGQFIGVAFTLPNQVEVGGIVPCIGMHTPRSTWAVNLGKYPFKFNIDAYICGDNIEKLEGFQYEERESQYLVTRQQIDEMAARGENFLNVFIPSSNVQEYGVVGLT